MAIGFTPSELGGGVRASSPPRVVLSPAEIIARSSHEQRTAVLAIAESLRARDGEGRFILRAYPGTGKTSTLIAATVTAIDQCGSDIRIAFLAYNADVSTDVYERTRSLNHAPLKVSTFHALGVSTVYTQYPNTQIDAERKSKLCSKSVPYAFRRAVNQLVSLAKQYNIGVDHELDSTESRALLRDLIDRFDILDLITKAPLQFTIDVLVNYALAVLVLSISIESTLIDYNDMLWVCTRLNLPLGIFDLILVDEFQDINPARLRMVDMLVSSNPLSTLVGVGDENQAIYAFTGAMADSMDIAIRHYDALVYPLTVSFRCSRAAVELAREYIPDIKSWEGAKEGSERHITFAELGIDYRPAPGDALLCRNTAPLLLAYTALTDAGIPCTIAGRDMADSMMRFIARLQERFDGVDVPIIDLLKLAEEITYAEIKIFTASDRQSKAQFASDRLDSLLNAAVGCNSIGAIKSRINLIFAKSNKDRLASRVVLSTIHRAKGREWRDVSILGFDELIPSKYAVQDWQLEQERNLAVVAVTRAYDNVIFVDLPENK